MDQTMKGLSINDAEYGYVHAVSGPGKSDLSLFDCAFDSNAILLTVIILN